jgi:septal ring factor EnvC (AmiA/AmiB activator)
MASPSSEIGRVAGGLDAARRGKAWRVRRSSGRLASAAAFAVALAIGAAVTPHAAQGTLADAARLAELERRATERLASLQKEADQLARQQRGLLDQLRARELAREVAAAGLSHTSAALARAEADVAAVSAQIDAAEAEIARLRPIVHRRVAALYAAGPQDTPRRWLASDDLAGTARAVRLLAAITAQDRRDFEQYAALRAQLLERRTTLEQRRAEIAGLKVKAVAGREAAAAAAAAHAAMVRQLDERRDLTARMAGELDMARQELQRQVAGMASNPAAPVAVLPLAPFKGALPWPAAGRVIGAFGRMGSSRFGTTVPRSGIEVAVAAETPVRAIHEGTVAFAGPFAGFGRLVIVDHGRGAFSLYGHLADMAVSRGDPVERGRQLGTSGHAPEGPARLYFELRVDARPVNPIEWLKP